jgi:hypothetical protein
MPANSRNGLFQSPVKCGLEESIQAGTFVADQQSLPPNEKRTGTKDEVRICTILTLIAM